MAQWYEAIHASKRFRLGTVKKDIRGFDYVYLQGVASCAVGTWVVFDELGVTIRMLTTSVGPAAVSLSANTSATAYSWFQRTGTASGLALTAFADNATVNATGTAGSVDDDSVATAAEVQVFGAIGRSAVNETTLIATFQLYNPYKSLALLD